MNTVNTQRFLDPAVLARIGNLELLARTVVEGFVAGLHRSPFKGFSVEFMSYRPYMPGDDPMHLDWKLFARTDRYYIKEFEDETNAQLTLLLDVSPSMHYASGAVTKVDYASFLAAALAYFMIRQRDGVGLTIFDDDLRASLPPRSTKGHLRRLLGLLESQPKGAATALGKPLHRLADKLNRRGLVVLISDFLGDADALADGLKHFRFAGHDVLVFHILDPQEVDFDFDDLVEFEDLETGETLLLVADEARARYQANFRRHQETLQQQCTTLGFDYTMLTTDQPLDHALFHYLAARRRRG